MFSERTYLVSKIIKKTYVATFRKWKSIKKNKIKNVRNPGISVMFSYLSLLILLLILIC